MSRGAWIGATLLGLCLTLLGTIVPGSMTVTYPDIMGCETGCIVGAAGFPIPFIADYPGISPANSADLSGAILGMDQVHWGRAMASFAVWVVVGAALAYAIDGRRRLNG